MLAFYLALIDQDDARDLFEAIYNQHRFTMLAVATRLLHDHHLAEDAVHDAFLRILDHLEKIGAMDCNKMRSYVVIIVRNIALDQLRLQNRRHECPLPEFGDELCDDRADLEQTVLDHELSAAFQAAIRELGQPHLDIIVLKMVHGFKSREIARMLQLPESTVRVYLHRARKLLITKLEDDPDADLVKA